MRYYLQRLVLSLSLASLLPVTETRAAIVVAGTNLVELYADHPSAATANCVNTGTLGGSFSAISDPAVTNIGGITYVSMDGNDYYRGPRAPTQVTGSGTRSIEVWARNDLLDPLETLVAWGARGDPRDPWIGNMAFLYGSSAESGAANHRLSSPQHAMGWNVVPAAGELHYLVYTYDGTTARVYADGVEGNSEDIELMTRDYPNPPFLLHAEFDGLPVFYPGLGPSGLDIAVVRIDTGVLSPSDITANFNAGVDARIPEPCSTALLSAAAVTLLRRRPSRFASRGQR